MAAATGAAVIGASALGAGSVAARSPWRIERPLRLVPFNFEGAACVKGTKTCWVTGGTFGAVPALAKTTNGGAAWSVPPSSAIGPRQAGIAAVSCPSLSRCIGVGGQMGRAQSAQVGREQIEHGRAALRIRDRRKVARGLMQQNIGVLVSRPDHLSVNLDNIACRIDFRALLANNHAIDLDAPGGER